MKAISAKVTGALQVGSRVPTCDNSGAKIVKIFSVKGRKTVKGQSPVAGVGDMVKVSIIKGRPDVRKTVVWAVVVRQRKEYRRLDGTRVEFEENAVAILKDEKGNPKGTIFKGPIAKEACQRWPGIAKVANIIV